MSTGTIFDVLNARYVAPDQIAQTFIAPSQFKTLVKPGNSLLVGARGTGKTTLLKMLKMSAFEAWDSPDKEDISKNLDYLTAFIANDRNWSSRVNDFAAQFEDIELQDVARRAVISNQVLRSIVKTASEVFRSGHVHDHLRSNGVDPLEAEIRFSRLTGKQILGSEGYLSTADVDFAFSSRSDAFITDVNAMRYVGITEKEVLNNNKWVFSDFLAPLRAVAQAFNHIVDMPHLKWCLCFDELELAHKSIRNTLFSYLRGADPSFYFKLATVPFVDDISEFQAENAPKTQHDFAVIELWNVKKDQKSSFMHSIAASVLRKQGVTGIGIEKVLGNSDRVFEELSEARYSNGSKFFHNFLDLADHDPSFRDYMAKRGTGVHDFYTMTEDRRAAVFRKIQGIVLVRNAFRRRVRGSNISAQHHIVRRTGARGQIYSGSQNIIDLCDNNPRFLLAVLDPLIAEFKRTGRQISPEQQIDSISQVSKQVTSVLKGEGIHPPYARIDSVYRLIQRIGDFFADQIHGPIFNPDPVLSFTISKDAPPALTKAIAYAIREGALLLEGDYAGSYLRDGLADKRMRLAYLFAPDFLLPIMLGREKSIEGILRPTDSKRRRHDAGGQEDLFRRPR